MSSRLQNHIFGEQNQGFARYPNSSFLTGHCTCPSCLFLPGEGLSSFLTSPSCLVLLEKATVTYLTVQKFNGGGGGSPTYLVRDGKGGSALQKPVKPLPSLILRRQSVNVEQD